MSAIVRVSGKQALAARLSLGRAYFSVCDTENESMQQRRTHKLGQLQLTAQQRQEYTPRPKMSLQRTRPTCPQCRS